MPTNTTVISVITSTIAVMAFLCVLAICILAYLGQKIPPELNTLAGGLVGSLGSMLVKTSPTETIKTPPNSPLPSNGTTPVTIEQPEGNPVPVTEQPKP